MTVPNTSSFNQWIVEAIRPQLIKRSINTALVVGTILNLINQSDALLGQGSINWLTLSLTYLVPYCVSTYSGAMSAIHNQKDNNNE